MVSVGRQVVVYGGCAYRDGPFSGRYRQRFEDVCVLHVDRRSWHVPQVRGMAPRARGSHRGVTAGGAAWFLGGTAYVLRKQLPVESPVLELWR